MPEVVADQENLAPKHVASSESTPEKVQSKRKAGLVATPRQKEMIRRTRSKVTSEAEASKVPSAAAAAASEPPASDAPRVRGVDVGKCVANLQLMLDVAKVFQGHDLPKIEEQKKSFTLQSADEGASSSIGVILASGTFYVSKALPQKVEELKSQHGPKSFVLDRKGGISLGWKRMGSVKEAFLDTNQHGKY